MSFYILVFTFAVLLQGIAVETWLAVLAAWAYRVVEAAQTSARLAVAGVSVGRVDVTVAGTLLTAGSWSCQVSIGTGAASVAAGT